MTTLNIRTMSGRDGSYREGTICEEVYIILGVNFENAQNIEGEGFRKYFNTQDWHSM